jgi:hypothetical protein
VAAQGKGAPLAGAPLPTGAGSSSSGPPKKAADSFDGNNKKKVELLTEELMYAATASLPSLPPLVSSLPPLLSSLPPLLPLLPSLPPLLPLLPLPPLPPLPLLPSLLLLLLRWCRSQSAVRHCRRNRKPLDPKLRDALIQRCGPAVQEVAFLRNESKPPFGRVDELAPSRHDRIPPACVVIMFNPFESSFELSYGDSARCLRRTRHFCCRACHRRLLRPAALPLTG